MISNRKFRDGILIFAVLLFFHLTASACPIEDSIEGSFIVRLDPGSSQDVQKVTLDIVNIVDKLGGHVDLLSGTAPFSKAIHYGNSKIKRNSKSQALKKPLVYNVTVGPEQIDNFSQLIMEFPLISMEQNCRIHLQSVPNDPFFSLNWAHDLIESVEAWKISSNAEDVVVAVIDTGVDIYHEDLKENIWVNSTELNGKAGVDDDGNGCIDDIFGCDIADNNDHPLPGNTSIAQHGTHVAGIIGAIGNNKKGVTGVSWKIKLMPIKAFSDSTSSATLSDLIKSVYYAVDNGADIINCSWGSKKTASYAEIEAFHYAISNNVLPVVAAGNQASLAEFYSPASIPGVFVVGSVNSLDEMSRFSNFGKSVHVLAPGGDSSAFGGLDESIYSTVPSSHGSYAGIAGTSMAAPFVSGLAALIKALRPQISVEDLKSIILQSADLVEVTHPGPLKNKQSYPRINLRKALQLAAYNKMDVNTDVTHICQSSCEEETWKTPALTSRARTQNFGSTSSCSTDNTSHSASYPLPFIAIFLLMAPLFLLRSFTKKQNNQ